MKIRRGAVGSALLDLETSCSSLVWSDSELIFHIAALPYRSSPRCEVASQTDPNDKRARLIKFTTRGRKLTASIQKYADAAEFDLEQQLGAKRLREFMATLHLIACGDNHSG